MKKNTMFKLIAVISVIVLVIGWFLPKTPALVCEIIAATVLFVTGILGIIVPSKEKTAFKLILLIALYLALLSWIIPASKASGSEVASLGLMRVSLYELINYPYLTFQFFLQPLLFVLAVGGMYGILSETGKFRNKLEKIAKSLKGKEIIFLVAVSFVLAILNSVFGLNLLLFIVIPAICGIVLLMGYDKITAFLTGFISPLIGTIGSTYAAQVTGYINQIIGSEFATEFIAKIFLFVLSFLIFAYALVSHAKKSKVKATEEELEYLGEKKQSKKVSWPIFLIFGILVLLAVLGTTDWIGVFETEFFTDLHTTITEWSIKDHTVIKYLIEDLPQFGKWAYAEMTAMVILASIILSLVYNFKLADTLKAFGKGVKKAFKPAVLITIACVTVIITAYHPFLITITDWMFGLISNVSGVAGKLLFALFGTINTMISTIVNVDMLYVVQSTVPLVSSLNPDITNILAVLTQAVYGLTLIVAPTSTIMLLGLSYLEIPYKDWLKSSWKLILGLLAIIFIVLLIVILL